MYATINFKTKTQLKQAVDNYVQYTTELEIAAKSGDLNRQQTALEKCGLRVVPSEVRLFAPGLGKPVDNGTETVEGPHFPEPHRWYAKVEVKDGVVVKVN